MASGVLQMFYSALGDFSKTDVVLYTRHYLRTADGGTLAVDITQEPYSQDDRLPIIVCVHGLSGGSHESYVRSVFNEAIKTGRWRGAVVNYRGCGFPSVLTTNQFYHGGYTDDLRILLLYLSQVYPDAPLYAFGCSLGANVLTKYCGEQGDDTPLKGAVAVSNPWNFWTGHLELENTWAGRLASRAMASNLRRLIWKHKAMFEHDQRLRWHTIYPDPQYRRNFTLYQFDNRVTALLAGYPNAEAYYHAASSDQYLPNVRIPLLGLSARDDPITSAKCIPYEAFRENPCTVMATTYRGSHLGWFEPFSKRRWFRKPVLQFFEAIQARDPAAKRHPTAPTPTGKLVVGGPMVYDTQRSDLGFRIVAAEEVEGGTGPAKAETLGF